MFQTKIISDMANVLEKPRGRLTPFAFYLWAVMEQCKKKYPDKNQIFQRFEKVCLRKWENMSDFHKKRFVQMSETDGERFEKEMKEFNEKKEQINKEKKEMKKNQKKEQLLKKKAAKKEEMLKKKAEKKRKRKDPNAPKGAKSSYMCFAAETRAKLLEENPSISVPEVGKKCGELWKGLSPAKRSKYEAMAAKDKERYKSEMEEYQAEKEAGESLDLPGTSKSKSEEADGEEESGKEEEEDDEEEEDEEEESE